MLLRQDKDGNVVTEQVDIEYEVYRKGSSEGVTVVDEVRAIKLYKDYCRMYPESEIKFTKRVREVTTKIIEHDLSDLAMEKIEEIERDALSKQDKWGY